MSVLLIISSASDLLVRKRSHALNNLDDEIGFIIMKCFKWLLEFGRYEKGCI